MARKSFFVVVGSGLLMLTACIIYINDANEFLKNINFNIQSNGPLYQSGIVTEPKPISTPPPPTKPPSPFDCYRNLENLPVATDILTLSPKKDKSIFFVETSCRSKEQGRIYLQARQACSVESAALMNPSFEVHVLFTSPASVRQSEELGDKMINMLLSYKNLKISHANIDTFFAGSPVERLLKSGLMETSMVPMVHLSDVMRFIVMWKYGAMYLDTDVVVLKSLEDLEPNFTALENQGALAAGIMRFDAEGKGHQWVQSILKDINADFKPQEWSYNANGALTRLLCKICNTSDVYEFSDERCQGYKIYSETLFYPVHYSYWTRFFDASYMVDLLRKLDRAYTAHIWNALSKDEPILIGNNTPYEVMAMHYCPKVYSLLQDGTII